MKRLFAVALLLSCLPLFAATVDNTITFSDHTGSPQAVKRVVVTPLTWGLYNSTNIALAIPITKQTDASGSVTVSNLASGYSYRVQLFNSAFTELGRFTNSFGTNVSGAVFARDYLTISTNLAGGTTAYSRDAADARFARTVVESTSNALTSGVLYIKTNYSASGSTYTNTSGTVGVIAGSGIGTNTSHLVGTNAWATTNALKADLAILTIAATNAGAYVAATNGTAYNLTIASGNGGGLTNVLASYVSGTLTNNTTGSAASLSSVITAAALASNTPFAPGSLLMANNGVNQNWSTNLLWNSGVLTIRDSLITNTWQLTSTGTVWGVSGARAAASMVVNTNSTLYGINTISTVSAFTASVGGASYAFDTADFRHSSGAQDLGRTSIPWGTGYFRNVSVRTNLFVTNSVYVVGGSYNGNGGGLTNLQATNIVFQDKVWSGTEVNDEGNAIIELNNGYQRYEWGANYFTITGITPAATGKPRWTSFKLLNTSLATMTLTISISNARAIGSASPFTIPDGKVAWITIHDDGQGTAWSITYAVAIEP